MTFLNATVADRVRAVIAAALPTVTVFAGPIEPGPEAPLESVLVDHEPSTWTWPTMRAGTRPLATTIGLRVEIETIQLGKTATVTQARWFELAGAVMTALRSDPTLQSTGAISSVLGLMPEGQIRAVSTAAVGDGTGWSVRGELTIQIQTRT